MGRGSIRPAVTVAIATLAIMLLAEAAPAQCAMCRRALQSPEGQQMVAAFRSGILFLLAAPFAAFGAVATLALRAERRRLAGRQPGTAGRVRSRSAARRREPTPETGWPLRGRRTPRVG